MEFVLLLISLALAGALAGVRMAVRARTEAERLRQLNASLEDRVTDRTAELQLALDRSEVQAVELAAANKTKSDFLAAMSHELRTPLNAVIGFAELMRMNRAAEPMTVRQAQAVDHILESGGHLLALIEEVLDLARIEAGRMSMSMERVDPQLVIRQVCDALRLEAAAAGVILKAPPPMAGLGVVADRTRLRQVLVNLVGNAIKFNQPGGLVAVEACATPLGVTIAVHDTGFGIPEGRMAELFQPFNRLGREGSSVPGTGVGLAVSHHLARAMNGRLEAESREGEGSTFTLWLPAAAAPALPAAPAPALAASLPPATMLYVEDNPSNIILMRHVMGALAPQISLHIAETGHEGLALARDLRPDIILLDINLPGLDGFELKARLDQDPLTQGLPVLALSAGARPADLQRGQAAGFKAYLTKPLDIPALAKALTEALAPEVKGRRAA
jgi:signal transduction histidine kinase